MGSLNLLFGFVAAVLCQECYVVLCDAGLMHSKGYVMVVSIDRERCLGSLCWE